ncbi:S-adenosyl-L-methionine-dependent methyltransferase [Sporodiniella umbellata]|nr:S-adenosyl-L-methionine-dependent methyltransferase [Sporodiniella umbellata]
MVKESFSSGDLLTQEVLSEIASKTTFKDSIIESKREFHDNESSTYWLPKDDEEQQRLTGQHFAIKELYEGNLLSSIKEALDFTQKPKILDVGCGSGIWLMDMYTDHPNADYHGCDIVDAVNKNVKINQFKFASGSITQGLPYPDNTFDCCHMRLFVLALQIEEWPLAINEIIRVTKPGGYIMINEGNLKLPPKECRAYYELLSAIHAVCDKRSQNPCIALELEKLIAENKGAELVQSDYRISKLNAQTCTSKKFVWDWCELAKGVLATIGPMLGYHTQEEQKEFIRRLRQCLSTDDCTLEFNAISARKL